MNEIHLIIACLILLATILILQIVKMCIDSAQKRELEGMIYHIDNNIVESGNRTMHHGEFNSACAKYSLLGTRQYLYTIMTQLSKIEEYEKAKELQAAINEIDKLIMHNTF